MTAQLLTFTRPKKARRETKTDIAARVVPTALGILAEADVYVLPDHVYLYREFHGFRVRADEFPGGSLILLTIHDNNGKELLRGYIPRQAEVGANVVLGGRFRLSRIDFAGRADWVPAFNALPVKEVGTEGWHDWFDKLNRDVLGMA